MTAQTRADGTVSEARAETLDGQWKTGPLKLQRYYLKYSLECRDYFVCLRVWLAGFVHVCACTHMWSMHVFLWVCGNACVQGRD